MQRKPYFVKLSVCLYTTKEVTIPADADPPAVILLTLLLSLQELAVYQRRELPGRLWGAELHEHYARLLSKYHIGPMRW